MILASFPADDHLLCFADIECNTPTVRPLFDFIQVTLEAFCAYDSIARILNCNMECHQQISGCRSLGVKPNHR